MKFGSPEFNPGKIPSEPMPAFNEDDKARQITTEVVDEETGNIEDSLLEEIDHPSESDHESLKKSVQMPARICRRKCIIRQKTARPFQPCLKTKV
jgi:hypothetical protein